MTTTTVAGLTVDRDPEGFFTDPTAWNRSMVPELAAEQGIAELTEEHWEVIDLMRRQYAERGTGPTVRLLGRISGLPVKRLYELFPKGPAKVAAKVAGIPKPRGCI
jgi:tRNA 2-thiouridine synthesizing protein E